MRIVCISASNIKHARTRSTSTKVCEIVKEIVSEEVIEDLEIKILRLTDYEFIPCEGCGSCYYEGTCPFDDNFSQIYNQLKKADAVFIVSAHYAPIPSKLSILLEKMEQIIFVRRFHDKNVHSPLYNKPVGIIAHGGGTDEIAKSYESVVIRPIANALSWPIEMDIASGGRDWPLGVAFGIKEVRRDFDSVFPIQIYDWRKIRKEIKPLVRNVCKKINERNMKKSQFV